MAKRKRVGRPPKPAKERKTVNFTFRSRGDMRERLRDAAAVSGRSISEEIEFRLEQSFQEERIAMAVLKALRDYLDEGKIVEFASKETEDNQL
jgi:Arc-like DNA binding domain